MVDIKIDDYYCDIHCPNCGRLRVIQHHIDGVPKRICEKCEYCIEDNDYLYVYEIFEENFREEYRKAFGLAT